MIVNAWIVVCDEQLQSAFVEGGPDGTIMVPVSEPAVLSVAGVEADGQLWERSSRGPAANYQPGMPRSSGPLMAHLADLSGEFGTSYSSPRACADAVVVIAEPERRRYCHKATDLICQAYELDKLPTWNARSGFLKRTQ